jgi:uncharacterized membrane protein
MSTTASPRAATYAPPDVASPPSTSAARYTSIDIIRGAVMVLMALDHVRVFAGVPAGGPTPALFFTRWVTHFCAPAFIFLAGTSAFLYGVRGRTRPELSRFLITRGAWLVLLELTFLRFAWTFNTDVMSYNLAGVIWVIGWCMIILGGLVFLPTKAVGAIGVAIIALHNLLPSIDGGNWLVALLYGGGDFRIGGSGPRIVVLYVLIPWVGVMAAGYGFGAIMQMDPDRRRRLCLRIGLGAIAAFLILRGFNLYGNPWPWGGAPTLTGKVLSFLNTAKYPASLQFLLMTLGPTIALIPLLEGARGRVAGVLSVFGRVPLFYYILHIPLIHAMALMISLVRLGRVDPWLFTNHPMEPGQVPAGYMYSLPLLYLTTAIAVALLYYPCRWFAGLKARRRDPWLSYL